MFSRLRRGLTFANVCSALALTIALGTGTAYAAGTVFSEDIVNGEVRTVDLAGSAVKTAKIDDGAVTSDKVEDGSLTAADLGTDSVQALEIADNSIDGGEIIDNSLGSLDLASSSVGSSELATNAVSGSKIANNTITTADILGADVNGHVSLSGVPNGRCSQVTMSVSGAVVGQVAVVATNGAVQNGILLYAKRVATAGHVEADICNFSGTTMDPITDLPVRIITFG